MNTMNQKPARRYDLDFLRVAAIILLLYYHTGMMYVSWGWHIQYKSGSKILEHIMVFLHQWRMPLLFLISGAGTYFALSFRTSGQYMKERFQRLFIPLFFGIFLIIPPQIYIERIFRGQFSGSYLDFYPSVFEFVPYPMGGSFSWHHLWFVLYLFLYSLLALPLFLYLRRESGKKLVGRLADFSRRKGAILLWILPLLMSQVLLKPFFPDESHALIDDWAYFTFNLIIFVYGYVLASEPRFWESLAKQRRFLLYAALGAIACLYLWYDRPADLLPKHQLFPGFYTWWLITLFVTWFSIAATLAYGYRYLNFKNKLIKAANEGVYPFYILHQTVIIIIGYGALQSNLGIYDGFLVVSTLSFAICVALYWFVIKRFWVLRFLFGLKVKENKPEEKAREATTRLAEV